jgi:hypothetical protein
LRGRRFLIDGIDPRIDLVGVRAVEAFGRSDLVQLKAGALDRLADALLPERASLSEHARDFPDVRTPDESWSPAGRPGTEDDARVLFHPEALIDQANGEG